ncbi:dienelactone hydrolase family protein [Rhizosaccharibacter radicis]|uniref:Dienelactone hydrolase family protein n=1 Tax=Rhizosaccharibacter radicis TaxID=2782605 RepID=A0ABT1VSK6_9PROT|nr:dienelactone hydrolase family protein [Acetobacteraceae bacterium KSS12]
MIIRSDEHLDVPMGTGTGTGAMRLHLFRPAGEGRFPGLAFFSEIYQVTAPIRRFAAYVAGHGFVVAVPEVYHEYEAPGTVLRYDQPGTDRGNELKFAKPVRAYDADAAATFDALEAHAACNGRLGAFGVCLGGHLAFRAALDPRALAAACFYATDIHSGTLGENKNDDSLARMAELKAETLFVWGRQDPHVPFAGRERIRARLEEVGASYLWHEVNGQHAFLRDEGPRYDPALFRECTGLMLDLFGRTLRR